MSQIILVKFSFKKDSKQVWLDWTIELKSRQDEVIETLKQEGVTMEACFISKKGDEIYYLMEAADFDRVKQMVSKSTHKIDAEHREVREKSLNFVEKMECLFYFENK
ncbi:MAG: DUF6176 family protein [Candidatus Magasanikbacteria bacterium]|nr:DUF6176 family protein [Candidatus Magasanikbacteria bacterium]